jgi:hypothetical protein
MFTKWHLSQLRQDYINYCHESIVNGAKTPIPVAKFIYYKNSLDARFLEKVIAADKIYSDLHATGQNALKIED